VAVLAAFSSVELYNQAGLKQRGERAKWMKEIGRKIMEAESYDSPFSAILYHYYNF